MTKRQAYPSIARVSVYSAKTGLPAAHSDARSPLPDLGRRSLFVVLETEGGAIGLGEASQSGSDQHVIATLGEQIPALQGKSLGMLFREIARMGRRFKLERSQRVAQSALEIAGWDAFARTLDVPLYTLFGGLPSDVPIPQYATLYNGLERADPAELADAAREAMEQGYVGVKVVPFRNLSNNDAVSSMKAPSQAWERIEAVRSAIGPHGALLIECYFAFDVAEAKYFLARLSEYDPFWVEAPLLWDDPDTLRAIRAQFPMRIASGETMTGVRDARSLLTGSAVDVLMPDVKWCGGFTEARGIAALAEAHQVPVAFHNNSSIVATRATEHLAVAIPNLLVMERPRFSSSYEAEVFNVEASLGVGEMYPAPGLGLEIDETHPMLERIL